MAVAAGGRPPMANPDPNPRIVEAKCRFYDWMVGEPDLAMHEAKEGTDETYLRLATINCSRDPLIKPSEINQRPLTTVTSLPCGPLGPDPRLPPGSEPLPPPPTEDPEEQPIYHICRVVDPAIDAGDRLFMTFTIPEKDEESKDEPQVYEQVVRATTTLGAMLLAKYSAFVGRTDEQDEADVRAANPNLDAFLEDADFEEDDEDAWDEVVQYESGVNLGTIALVVVAAGVVSAGLYFAYRYWTRDNDNDDETAAAEGEDSDVTAAEA